MSIFHNWRSIMPSCQQTRTIIFTGLFLFLILFQNKLSFGQVNLSPFLPKEGEIDSWKPVGKLEKAVGDDLFILINGGAEIYHEYGFKQVVMQEYQNDNQKSINVEIYEMNDAASAFGIYTFKTSPNGKEIELGQAAVFEDYYLNFWKNNFLVTLTGFDTDQETIEGIIAISRAIDSKIMNKGLKPILINLLPEENLIKKGLKYLKGNIALFNSYEFSTGDIFGLKEGIIGDYGVCKLFIFKYENQSESKKWFENARKNLESDARSNSYNRSELSDYYFIGRNEDRFLMKLYQNYIIILSGTTTKEGRRIFKQVQAKIKYETN